MQFSTYKKLFAKEARKKRHDEAYIATCLDYARLLAENNVPIIYSIEHFSLLTGMNLDYLLAMSRAPEHFYREFTIPKKNGGQRLIDEPTPDLKYIQRWILDNILINASISPCAKGFVTGLSIKDSAKFHINQNVLLNVDIKDFFSSISINYIYDVFYALGYSKKLSWFFSYLCTFDGRLPQGAPSSPYLSNLVMKEIDEKTWSFARDHGYRYSRYADDISLSGDVDVSQSLSFLRNVLKDRSLCLNPDKTRVLRRGARQEVTGVVVNTKMGVPRTYRKKIRQEIYYIKKYGIENHLARLEMSREFYQLNLLGRINHVLFINPRDSEMLEYRDYLKKLIGIGDK